MATKEEIKEGMKLNAYRLFCQHCQALQKVMGWEGNPCWVTQYNEPTAVCASAIDAIDGWIDFLHSEGVVIKVDGELPQCLNAESDIGKVWDMAQQSMLKAGCVFTKPLIEEKYGD